VSFTIPQVTFLLSYFHIGSVTTGRASRQPPSVRVTSYLPWILAISRSTRFVFSTPLTRLAPFTQATSYSGFYTSNISNHVGEWRLFVVYSAFWQTLLWELAAMGVITKMSKTTTVQYYSVAFFQRTGRPHRAPPNANGNRSMWNVTPLLPQSSIHPFTTDAFPYSSSS
jgi:hypothetical protein